MLPGIFLVLCLASVALTGGRLGALADLRLRAAWAVFAAIGVQVVVISLIPDQLPHVLPLAHVASYGFAAYFVLANRRVPGVLLIGLGGAMNLAAIAANGGTMPASESALASAGLLKHVSGEYLNSAALANPQLAFLGDIFAIPKAVPFHNVFSLGDITIALGTALGVHRICRSRLFPSASGQFSALMRQPGFTRVWVGQAASNTGDFIYSLAILVVLTSQGFGAQVFATLLIVQVASAAVSGLLASPLIDRWSRKRLMIGSDLCRAVAICSLIVVPAPSLVHFYVVAALLGAFRAIFQPSLRASLPNLVPAELLVAANSVVSATFNAALMIGPVLGALVAAHLGLKPALAINMATFVLSGLLLARVRVPQQSSEADHSPTLRALVEGLVYSVSTPLIRGVLLVTGVAMFAGALRAPMEPLFITKALGARPESLGFVEGAWGVGMVLGSFAAPAVAGRWIREHLLGVGFGVMGVAIVVASQATSVFPVLLLWLVAGAANAIVFVSYSSLLQESAPDRLRGRVVAASEVALDAAFIGGALLIGVLGGGLGPRLAYVLSGTVFVLVAAVSPFLLGKGARRAGRLRPLPESNALAGAQPVAEPRPEVGRALEPAA